VQDIGFAKKPVSELQLGFYILLDLMLPDALHLIFLKAHLGQGGNRYPVIILLPVIRISDRIAGLNLAR